MKQFDGIFRQQAKDTFSGYDAGRLADAGWNAFLQKRKSRRGAGIIIPLWARAASVALLLTAGSLLTYHILDTRPASVIGEPVYGTLAEETPPLRLSTHEPAKPVVTESEGIVSEIVPVPTVIINGGEDRVIVYETALKPAASPDNLEWDGVNPAAAEPAVVPEENRAEVVEEVIVSEQPEDTLQDEREERTRRTFLMAGLSGIMARAEDISSGLPGVSLGVYGEHRISRRWAVRPGIVLAMQNLGMGTVAAEKNMDYATPALGGAYGSIESFDGNLQLLAMEVPVNLVYTIMERGRSGLYVSAGASTMFFLNQNVSGNFRNAYTRESFNTSTGELATETWYSSVSVESSEAPFSHTDFFGLANFSAAYSMPFGKSNKLLIEPYIQLPVNTLTSLNLRIRYGGVSLKIRFGQTSREPLKPLAP